MSRELELITAATLADTRAGPAPARAGDGPKHADAHRECLNCGAALEGRFCAACGQAADDHHRAILHLAWEVIEDFTHLDGRLARTIPPLFFRPGRLARDHFEGRRQRHVPPLRLFLVALLLFMFVLEVVMHGGALGGAARSGAVTTRDAQGGEVRTFRPSLDQLARWSSGAATPEEIDREVRAGSGEAQAPSAPGVAAPTPPAPPALQAPANPVVDAGRAAPESVQAWFTDRMKRAAANPDYYKSIVFEWAHRLAFLLLPIFALQLTVLFFYKRRYFVYDHLVVSMQFLSFVFLISAAAWVLPPVLRNWAVPVAAVWTPVNLFMLLRGAYGSGVIGATLKTLYLWVSTLVTFSLMLAALLALGLQQI